MPRKTQTAGAILIVDDSGDDAVLTRYALNKLKLLNPVRTVATAEEMIAYLEGNGGYANRTEFPDPTLILLDLKLPQMTKLEALKWLRSTQPHRAIPIFVMSNDMSVHLLEAAVKSGANGYLVKRITQESFRTLCERENISLQQASP